MRTLVLSMPDNPVAVPGWLDRQLVGPHLDQLVAELEVVHGTGEATDLIAVLGNSRAVLLAKGFAHVPQRVLSALLTSPALLLELQADVFEFGGPYWQRLTTGAEPTAVPHRPARSLRWLSYVGVSMATAAAVLVAVFLGGGFRTPPTAQASSGWGFAKVKDLPRDGGPKRVFSTLAEFADEWEKKQPDDAAGMARRLHEFREGCTALQLADDLPLSVADTLWLKGRCAEWSAEIDAHLRTLERSRDVPAVSTAATATSRRIAAELRQQVG